ncbi:hypothetical protein MTO96_051338 [Rhipicephalus appendiculatus]
MAEASLQPTNVRLATETWQMIAQNLDVESLLSMHESGLLPSGLLQSAGLTRRLTLSPHSDENVLASFLDRIDPNSVHRLCVANCLMVSSGQLLDCFSRLANLAELDCVNCPLGAGRLFTAIATHLPVLSKLRWSIREEPRYIEDEQDFLVLAQLSPNNLRHMYVETSFSLTAYFILFWLHNVSRNLEHLHLHAIDGSIRSIPHHFVDLIGYHPNLTSFAFTSEGAPNNEQQFRDFDADDAGIRWFRAKRTASACGNVFYWGVTNTTCTCVYVADIANWAELHMSVDQIILCVEDKCNVPAQLKKLAEKRWWSRFRSLTLALPRPSMPPGHGVIRYILPAYITPLRALLAACTNLTELNLSLCHFGRRFDWSDVVASRNVLRLRAIALPQCALKTAASVERLAALCPLLHELDVCTRSTRATYTDSCPSCCSSFVAFNRMSMRALCERTRLQRLTLCDVFRLRCLNFLSKCSTLRLRLSWRPDDTFCCTARRIATWLSGNRHLRMLTLRPRDLDLTTLCAELSNADLPSLRTLCIILDTTLPLDRVQDSLEDLLTSLQSLEIFHAHFVDPEGMQVAPSGENKDKNEGAAVPAASIKEATEGDKTTANKNDPEKTSETRADGPAKDPTDSKILRQWS